MFLFEREGGERGFRPPPPPRQHRCNGEKKKKGEVMPSQGGLSSPPSCWRRKDTETKKEKKKEGAGREGHQLKSERKRGYRFSFCEPPEEKRKKKRSEADYIFTKLMGRRKKKEELAHREWRVTLRRGWHGRVLFAEKGKKGSPSISLSEGRGDKGGGGGAEGKFSISSKGGKRRARPGDAASFVRRKRGRKGRKKGGRLIDLMSPNKAGRLV